uniref:Uncharacterized protein n=1 Tax=Rhizophora mucronata TaxID=61149 RepID=A0A2P2ISU8_RHIMU
MKFLTSLSSHLRTSSVSSRQRSNSSNQALRNSSWKLNFAFQPL